MKKNIIVFGSVLMVTAVMLSTAFMMGNTIEAPKDVETVRWYTFEEAVQLQKKEPKKIFIDVYTDWCGWCKKMDASTFNNPTVAAYLNDKYYPVKFNAEQREDVNFTDPKSNQEIVFKFIPSGRRGYHQLAATLLQNKLSYPTVVFLDEGLNMIQPLAGYQKPDTFYPIIEFFGDNHYKSMSWPEFQKVYKSPFLANR